MSLWSEKYKKPYITVLKILKQRNTDYFNIGKYNRLFDFKKGQIVPLLRQIVKIDLLK